MLSRGCRYELATGWWVSWRYGSRGVRSWTVEEFFGGAAQPTEDDVPIALDGRVLDTPAKVIAYIEEINAARAAAGRDS